MAKDLTFVHSADVHLDSTFAQAQLASDLGQALRHATRAAFKRVLDLVKSEDADALLLAGDLYDHEYVTPDTGAFLVEALAALGDTPVLIAPGNHDPYLPDSLYARLDWPPNVHIFDRQVPSTFTFPAQGFAVHGVAHCGFHVRDRLIPRFQDLAVRPADDDGLVHVAVAHGSDMSRVPDDKEDAGPFQPADLAVPGLRYWALGHYHAAGAVQGGGGVAAWYAGCVQGRHFGETGPRHALVVAVSDADVSVRPTPVNTLSFETAEVDVGAITHSDALIRHIRGLYDAPAWADAIVRLILVGEAAPTLEIQPAHLRQQVASVFHHVTFIDRTRPVLDAGQVAVERTARGEFVRRIKKRLDAAETDAAREELWLALRVGLAAYDGRGVPVE